jgi:DNA-binding GntR family transcriptional regulator
MNTSEPHKAQVRTSGRIPKPERASRPLRATSSWSRLCARPAPVQAFQDDRPARHAWRHAAEAVEEHSAIYRAIRDGDADAATVHLDNTLEDYRRDIRLRVFGGAGRPDGTVAP